MSQSRQLAAIMFTDIVGYTALMGRDEQRAFALLKKNREIQKPLVKHFNGTWIKELGDGVLASFYAVTDAVLCSSAIHKASNEVPGLKLRIGIHLGEVIFENNDVFGDGVNIASRLQALAPIGATFISEAVYKNVVNKNEFITEFIREETLKNVQDPVKVYEIKMAESSAFQPAAMQNLKQVNKKTTRKSGTIVGIAGLVFVALLTLLYFIVYRKGPDTKNYAEEKSIAVLYFQNMSGDPDQEYFSDGVTEEIITHLSGIRNIRVISRTSVLSYKGKPLNLRKIAEELDVSSILEGSVRKAGSIVRISAQLIDAHTDEHIWSVTFDRELKDIFQIQSDIARGIVQKFEIDISPEDNAKISHIPTQNVEAYDLFQKGKFFMYTKYANSRQQEDFEKAKIYLERAIQLDPVYADAYAGLAELYDVKRNLQGKEFPVELENEKESLARKALGLNPGSSYANFAMAYALLHRTAPNVDSSFFFFKNALRINPSDPLTNSDLSVELSFALGLHSTAIPFNQKAIKLDPLDPNNYAVLGYQYCMLGNYVESKKAFRTAMNLTKNRFKFEARILPYLVYLGDFKEVEERLHAREGSPGNYRFAKSVLLASTGRFEKVDPEFRDDLTVLLAANKEKVLKNVISGLEAEIEKGTNSFAYDYHWLSTSSYFNAYREDPDFKRLLSKAKNNYEANLRKYGNIGIPDK